MTIQRKHFSKFLKMAGDRLHGDWIVIGGTVLPLLGIHHRVTLDIDIVGPKESDQEAIFKLMEIAEQIGVPVEAINQAGAYFLHKIKKWESKLVPLYSGSSARIFRPNVTLFLLLKMARLTESDLSDCLEFLRFAKRQKEIPDFPLLKSEMQKLLKKSPSLERKKRLVRLLETLESF